MPEPRYFSIPSIVVGACGLQERGSGNWTPVRYGSLIQFPAGPWTNSPPGSRSLAAWPRNGNQVRVGAGRALTRSTSKAPLSTSFVVEGDALDEAG